VNALTDVEQTWYAWVRGSELIKFGCWSGSGCGSLTLGYEHCVRYIVTQQRATLQRP